MRNGSFSKAIVPCPAYAPPATSIPSGPFLLGRGARSTRSFLRFTTWGLTTRSRAGDIAFLNEDSCRDYLPARVANLKRRTGLWIDQLDADLPGGTRRGGIGRHI